MKKLLLSVLVISSHFLSSQILQDTMRIKVPYIGKNGGAYTLGWSFNKHKDKIFLYTYSHINGYQLVASPEEISEARANYNKKSWLGQFLDNATKTNRYSFAIMPIVASTRIDIEDKKYHHYTEVFHKVDNVQEGKNVYFMKNDGMISFGKIPFYAGDYIRYHYKNINKSLLHTPKIPNEIMNFLVVEYKREGTLGLKNIRPVIVRKKAEFIYDDSKGFYTKTQQIIEKDFAQYSVLNNYTALPETSNIEKQSNVVWLTDKKGSYIHSYYNGETNNEPEFRKYEFDNNRELKVGNHKIFNDKKESYGYLSIFGYDKKQDKNKRKYSEDELDVIITDLQGNEISRKLVKWGTKDTYKHLFNPLEIFYDNGKLKIMNIQGLFKLKYELLEYDIDKGQFMIKESNGIAALKDYLYQYDNSYTLGNKKIYIKNIKDYLDVNNMQSPKVNAGFNMLVIDEDYNVLNKTTFKDVLKGKNGEEKIFYQKVLSTNEELVLLGFQGSSYYLIKVDKDGKIDAKRIKTPFEQTSENYVYFGYSNLNPGLVDIENRKIYLINQYYQIVDNNIKILDEVGISVVSF